MNTKASLALAILVALYIIFLYWVSGNNLNVRDVRYAFILAVAPMAAGLTYIFARYGKDI